MQFSRFVVFTHLFVGIFLYSSFSLAVVTDVDPTCGTSLGAKSKTLSLSTFGSYATSIMTEAMARNQSNGTGQLLAMDVLFRIIEVSTDSSGTDIRTHFNNQFPLNESVGRTTLASQTVKEMRKPGSTYSREVEEIIKYANIFATDDLGVTPTHLLMAILYTYPKSAENYFQEVGINKIRAKKMLTRSQSADPRVTAVVDLVKEMKIGRSLNEAAAEGEYDTFSGRDVELKQIINVLSRKNKNSVLLVGDAGVGKKSIAGGLAKAIVDGNVPKSLKNRHLISFNIGNIVAGTAYRGQLEEKVAKVLDAVKATEGRAILFINQIHSLAQHDGTILNMILNMSSQDLTIIGTTTPSNRRKYLSLLPDIDQRFVVQEMHPTTDLETQVLLSKKVDFLTADHPEIKVNTDAIEWATIWAKRYKTQGILPDTAIDLLDATISMVANRGGTVVGKSQVAQQLTEQKLGVFSALMDEGGQGVEKLESTLNQKVIGQKSATNAVARSLRRSKMGLTDPNRPVGSFLFLGPTGVGKTELAKSIARYLGTTMQRFDMSEYQDKHTVSALIGSPPGYVGYAESGALIEAIQRNPTGVFLMDEIEKAHPDVLNVLLQAIDDGIITGLDGRKADLKNAILVMTSNAGTQVIKPTGQIGYQPAKTSRVTAEAAATDKYKKDAQRRRELFDHFKPEFVNRIDYIIDFNSLSGDDIAQITRISLDTIFQQLLTDKSMHVSATSTLIEYLARIGFDETFGGRHLNRTLNDEIRDFLTDEASANRISDGDTFTLDYDSATGKIVLVK